MKEHGCEKRIIYLGYYYKKDMGKEDRLHSLAATNKMDYIAKIMSKSYPVEIVSVSGVTGEKCEFGYYNILSPNFTVKYFLSLGRKNAIRGKISTLVTKILAFLYLVLSLRRNDVVVVYHSLGIYKMVSLLHMLKKNTIILELEEIYGDVCNKPEISKQEIRFANECEKYIFPTQLLSRIVNVNRKPEAIIHGTYNVEDIRNNNVFINAKQTEKNRIIHCVYAGTLDPRKGAPVAAASTVFLPNNYHIHIIGFGSSEDIQKMKELCKTISSKSEAKVSYDGLLSGEDYIRFIQSCDIGLSTQDPTAAFNATSFPSKILSYLANGLRVVSIKIPAIEESAVGDMLYYYTKQTPEEIANAIKSVNIDEYYNSRERISKLSNSFERELKTLLEEF